MGQPALTVVAPAEYTRIGVHEVHPAADIFPLMDGAAFDALCDDIKANGLRTPIIRMWVDAGLGSASQKPVVLDGRNRLRACLKVKVAPHWCEHDNAIDPLKLVLSNNMHRRHLDESQRAMVAARIARLGSGQRQLGPSAEVATQPQAAELLNVSERLVRRAKRVLRDAPPETIAAVDRGEIAVTRAEAQISEPTRTSGRGANLSALRARERDARDARDEEIRVLLDDGLSVSEIAERLGVHATTVSGAKTRLGLTRKSASRANPLHGLLATAVEFTDAFEDALKKPERWESATAEQRQELRDQLGGLVSATKKLMKRLGTGAAESDTDQ